MEGNAHADAAATAANESRPHDFLQLQQRFQRAWHLYRRNVHDCQNFLLEVAQSHGTITNEEAVDEMPLATLLPTRATEPNEHLISDAFSGRLPADLVLSRVTSKFGHEVVESVLGWTCFLDEVATESMSVFFLELYVGWLLSTHVRLPLQDPCSKQWVSGSHILADSFPQSLANRLAVFRAIVVGVCSDLGVQLQFEMVDLKDYYVYRRIPGLRLGMPHFIHDKILGVIRDTFKASPWRRQTDVARVLKVDPDPQICGLRSP